jgi:hypothetical protein
VFRRVETTSTYSRISTLLQSLQLDDRESMSLAQAKDILGQDFSTATRRLAEQRAGLSFYVGRSLRGLPT